MPNACQTCGATGKTGNERTFEEVHQSVTGAIAEFERAIEDSKAAFKELDDALALLRSTAEEAKK